MNITKHRYEDGNTEAWLALRKSMKGMLGGSEIGTVAGHNSYCSPFTFFCQTLGVVKRAVLKKKEAIIQGHDGEQGVADRFEREMGKRVHRENCIITNDAYPHLKASVDRMLYGEKSGLECKTAKDMGMKKYKHGDFPMSYFDQCLLYLAVTQMDRWYLAIQVFGTAFRMFMMTRIEAEAKRFEELKAKFCAWEMFKGEHYLEWTWNCEKKQFDYEGDEDENGEGGGIPAGLEIPEGLVDVNDPDLAEWEEKWCKLEAVYFVDDEELAACESIAKIFEDRVQCVEDSMEGKTFGSENERMAALTAAVCQVWPREEIDGSESTCDTISVITPDAVVDSVVTMDDDSEVFHLAEERDRIDQQMKELAKEKSAVENKIEMAIGCAETVRMSKWKLTYKMGTAREYASAEKVKAYFASQGKEVPEGMIKTGEPSRTLRFWTQKAKNA